MIDLLLSIPCTLAVIDFEQALEKVVSLLSLISLVAIFGAFLISAVMAATGRIAAMATAIVAAIVAALAWAFLRYLYDTLGAGTGVDLPSF